MAKQKIGLKSAKRFGVRYGPTNKLKLSIIETEQRKFQPCPVCGKARAAWQSVGIFKCGKCKAKFTARAYSAAKTVISEVIEEAPKQVVEEE
ncbi:MAG: 50S ribosomal protein L37ae [Nanoarchaeota archaeon]